MDRAGAAAPHHGFTRPAPPEVELSTIHTVFRKSDGTELGVISQFGDGKPFYSRHTSFLAGGSRSSECSDFDTVDEGLAWIAANPHLPDVTSGDENIVRLNNILSRIVCRLPGQSLLCRDHANAQFSLNAYRDGKRIGYVIPTSAKGYRVTVFLPSRDSRTWKPTLSQAWISLIRAIEPDNASGHEKLLWQEALAAEKRRIRTEPEYPACLLAGVQDGR